MSTEQLELEIAKLATADKLTLVEKIWDEIAKDQSDIPIPDWQKQALDQRLSEAEKSPQTKQHWQDVHQALREKYK